MRGWLALLMVLVLLGAAATPVTGFTDRRMVWVPLDSRPVNTDEIRLFGQASGWQVLMPPPAALDWYAERRSDLPALVTWLTQTVRRGDLQVFYSNNLLSGGLIASRDAVLHGDLDERLRMLQNALVTLPSGRRIGVHILPRALPTPFRSAAAPSNDAQYEELLRIHKHMLQALLRFTQAGLLSYLVVGLDDAQPAGAVNLLHEWAATEAKRMGIGRRVFRYVGADEIGFMILAKEATHRAGLAPSVQVEYDDESAQGLLLPFEGERLGESAQQKLRFLGAAPAPNGRERVFVHSQPLLVAPAVASALIRRMQAAHTAQRGLTLVDVTSPGARDAAFLQQLKLSLPLAAISYAGWNTASNALGTGLAMAAVSDLQRHTQPSPAQALAFRQFQALRYGYDWGYQSQKEALLAWAAQQGIDPDHLGARQPEVVAKLANSVGPQVRQLLNEIYGVGELELALRWDRIFEVYLKPVLR